MSIPYANAKKALGTCDVCGFTYKLKVLKELIVKNKKTDILACPECWNPDQPQLRLGEFPVYDPQALRNPRVDSPQYAQSRALILPVFGIGGLSNVGMVTIVIT
jgi:hypothetical protein